MWSGGGESDTIMVNMIIMKGGNDWSVEREEGN